MAPMKGVRPISKWLKGDIPFAQSKPAPLLLNGQVHVHNVGSQVGTTACVHPLLQDKNPGQIIMLWLKLGFVPDLCKNDYELMLQMLS